MNTQQQKVLAATLCGLMITIAGAFAVQPALTDSAQQGRTITTVAVLSTLR